MTNPTSSQEKLICTICLKDITSQSTVSTNYCGHTYHKPCLDQWFADHVSAQQAKAVATVTFSGCGSSVSTTNSSRTQGCGGSSAPPQPRVSGCGGSSAPPQPRVSGCGGSFNADFEGSDCTIQ